MSHSKLNNVLRKSGFGIAVVAVGYSFTLLCHLILTHTLAVHVYGGFAIFMTLAIVIAPLALMGVDALVLKLVPAYRHHRKQQLEKGLLFFGLKAFCVSQCFFILLAFALCFLPLDDSLDWLCYVWVFPIYAIMLLMVNILRSLFSQILALFTVAVLFWFLFAVLLICYHFLFGGEMHRAAPLLFCIAILLTLVLQIIMLRKDLSFLLNRSITPHTELKEWSLLGLRMMLVTSQGRLTLAIDFIALKIFGPATAEVGIYSAAIIVVTVMWRLSSGMNMVMVPIFSQLLAKRDFNQLKKSYRHDFWIRMTIVTPFAIGIIIFGKEILGWFGEVYVAGYGVLILLTVAAWISVPLYSCQLHLFLDKHQKLSSRILLITLGFILLLCVILIPHYGMWGAAIAFAIGKCSQNFVFYLARNRDLKRKFIGMD